MNLFHIHNPTELFMMLVAALVVLSIVWARP